MQWLLARYCGIRQLMKHLPCCQKICPYYTELQTRKRVTNDFDYFKRLHECVLTMVSKELQDAELFDLFEMIGVDLTDEELDDFGDK